MLFLFATLTAFLVGFLVTPIVIFTLHKMKIGDAPGGRRIHKKFIPSMGGIGFVFASFVALYIWGWQNLIPDIRFLLGGISLMFIVGFRDDLVQLKATHKILWQLLSVSLVVILSDIRIQNFHGFLGVEELNLFVSYSFSAFVLLALTNAFNLIDGLDGLAGTSAALALAFLGFWFTTQGLNSYALLSFVFLGAVLAFLFFNWYPAKIFMGDTGSLTLGFVLGALIITFMDHNSALPENEAYKIKPAFTAGIVLMILPLYDMGRVFTRRILRGDGPMTPDRCHVHHFLLRMGLKHNQVTLVLFSVQIFFLLVLFSLRNFSDHLAMPLVASLAIALGFRLDQITIKYVKKKVAREPRILELRQVTSIKNKKIKLDKKEFQKAGINLN